MLSLSLNNTYIFYNLGPKLDSNINKYNNQTKESTNISDKGT